MNDASPPIDYDLLTEQFGEDAEEMLADLAEFYLEDLDETLPQLKAAVAVLDAEAASQIAHAIKGASQNLAMTQMGQLCDEVEQLGKAGKTTRLAQLTGQIEAELGRIRAYFAAQNLI